MLPPLALQVEGFEPVVVAGAAVTLRDRPPRAMLTEYTPGVTETQFGIAAAPSYARSLLALRAAGYAIWQISPFGCGPKGAISQAMTLEPWAALPLAPCPAVTDAAPAACSNRPLGCATARQPGRVRQG